MIHILLEKPLRVRLKAEFGLDCRAQIAESAAPWDVDVDCGIKAISLGIVQHDAEEHGGGVVLLKIVVGLTRLQVQCLIWCEEGEEVSHRSALSTLLVSSRHADLLRSPPHPRLSSYLRAIAVRVVEIQVIHGPVLLSGVRL